LGHMLYLPLLRYLQVPLSDNSPARQQSRVFLCFYHYNVIIYFMYFNLIFCFVLLCHIVCRIEGFMPIFSFIAIPL
jgi:hypothetical protein